ncbi:hypothetical protein ACH347_41210 [Saccharopolyspora sp. 5N102]|uniref:hypothetical protein n=1 Tax=Saccharopolyspora sp. 5N102 TaxID=3375155 RepID=UPI0037AF210E
MFTDRPPLGRGAAQGRGQVSAWRCWQTWLTLYPNGRKLTDDVTSMRLAMVSGGKITTDHIGPHDDLLGEFPYLGAPHGAPVAG